MLVFKFEPDKDFTILAIKNVALWIAVVTV